MIIHIIYIYTHVYTHTDTNYDIYNAIHARTHTQYICFFSEAGEGPGRAAE